MKPSLYLETTIPSFIIGEISPSIITAGRQLTTRRWWEEEREKYRLFVSSVVEEEVLRGKASFAQERAALLKGLVRLVVDEEVGVLAKDMHAYLRLPQAAETDALHLAAACYYQIDYLLTWNMKHLANARIRREIERYCHDKDILAPVICTPDELAGWSDEP